MATTKTALLTDAQRDCLRLVLTHHSSKEIAGLLGVSPSAIDKRIERAVQIVGAPSRFAAARLLAQEEGLSTSDRTPCDVIDLSGTPMADEGERGSESIARRLLGIGSASAVGGRPRNDLTKPQRLALIAAIILFTAISSMALLNMAQTLSRILLEHHAASSR